MKPQKLKPNDCVAIVSLSSGILGEPFVAHEVSLGEQRLSEFGLKFKYMPNAKKGMDYIKAHPEKRAEDLRLAFLDKEVKMIICAIGGNDTHLTLPYLLNDDFKEIIKNNPKIFLGFSDTTTNHLMLYKLGLNTFYGQAYLPDLAELDTEMHTYTKNAFMYLFDGTKNYEILPSDEWFEDRTDYSPNAVGTPKIAHKNTGYDIIQGSGKATGKLLGGCLDVMADFILPASDENLSKISKEYNIFPSLEDWKDKIMFIETSDLKMSPETFKTIIQKLKEMQVFEQIKGLLVGKPYDNVYYSEYRQILASELGCYSFPVMCNINIGHAYPHTILPLNAMVELDADNKKLTIVEDTLL